jgi:hypothetical protein
MRIDCDTCVVRGDACSDCVVMFLSVPVEESGHLREEVPSVVEMDAAQARAIARLAAAGLVAPLRHLA